MCPTFAINNNLEDSLGCFLLNNLQQSHTLFKQSSFCHCHHYYSSCSILVCCSHFHKNTIIRSKYTQQYTWLHF